MRPHPNREKKKDHDKVCRGWDHVREDEGNCNTSAARVNVAAPDFTANAGEICELASKTARESCLAAVQTRISSRLTQKGFRQLAKRFMQMFGNTDDLSHRGGKKSKSGFTPGDRLKYPKKLGKLEAVGCFQEEARRARVSRGDGSPPRKLSNAKDELVTSLTKSSREVPWHTGSRKRRR